MRLVTDELLHFSTEPEKCRDFYVQVLGCRVISEEDWGFIFMELPDGARLGLMHPRNWSGWSPGQPLPAPVLCLKTDKLAAAIAQMKDRGARVSEPDAPEGGARGCRITDPDGRTIYLFEDPSEPLPGPA